MIWYSASLDVVSWIVYYISIVSLLLTVTLIVEAVRVFRQGKLWFPIFTINIIFIIIMQTLMVPLNTTTTFMIYNINLAKFVNIMCFFITLVNYLPSLGVMNDKQLFVNLTTLAIIIFNYIFNLLTSEASKMSTILLVVILFISVIPFSLALTIPVSRETMIKQLKRMSSHPQTEIETPQFVIESSPLWCFWSYMWIFCFSSTCYLEFHELWNRFLAWQMFKSRVVDQSDYFVPINWDCSRNYNTKF